MKYFVKNSIKTQTQVAAMNKLPWKKATIILLACMTLLAAFVGLLLPSIIKTRAVEAVQKETGRTLAIGDIAINPFTWTVRVDRVRLSEKGSDARFLSFSSVRAGISPSSIFRGAPVISEITLASPAVTIVRTGANAYNFSDLLEKKGKSSSKDKDDPDRFSINNITLTNGSVDFIDKALPSETRHRIEGLELAIPFFSNIPYLAERYVTPRLAARINGAPFLLEGKLKPFATTAEYTLNLDLKDLDIPFYASYFPGELPVRLESGRLGLALEVTHRAVKTGKPELEARGTARLDKLAISDRNRAPLFRLDAGRTEIAKAGLLGKEFNIKSLEFTAPELFVDRDAAGTLNLARLGGNEKSASKDRGKPAKDAQRKGEKQGHVTIAATRLSAGTVHFNDRVPKGGFRTDLRDITMAMDGFSTEPDKKGAFNISLITGRGEKGQAKGELTVSPMLAVTDLAFNDLILEAYNPYLAGVLKAPIKGRADLAANLRYDGTSGLTLDKTEVKLTKLSAPFAKGEEGRIASLLLSGGRFEQAKNELEIGEIAVRDGSFTFSRNERGEFSPMALLSADTTGKPTAPAGKGAAKAGANPFKYRIKGINGSGLALRFTDGMKEVRPEFSVKKLSFNLSNLTGPDQGAMPVKLAALFNDRGNIKISGALTPSPFKLRGDCILERIPLADFDPYLPDNLNLVLADGSLDATIGVDLARKGENMTGTFRGGVGLRNFYTLDGADNEDLLKWESLQLDKVSGSISPFNLNISQVALNKFYSRIVVNKNGVLNLQQLYTEEGKSGSGEQKTGPGGGGAQTSTAGGKAAQPQPQAPAGGKKISIETVTMQDGVISFTDRHTRTEYSTTMVNLGGRISGLSSEESKFADVDLRGNLENHSPLRITGKINPLRDDLFVDLKASFTDIELSPVTPYSGTYLGYAVDRGKLFLDLKYLIQNKKLDSENKIFIDQLTFGEKIDSEKATNLPVRLAVALLKDRKGEIHLDLPVSGKTDDPEFSVWRVVFQILRNLLVKAATAPFSLLQSMLGGAEDFSGIQFAPGVSRLTAAEQEKLTKLAQVLRDRPALKLELTGYVEKEKDAEGYRNELLLKKMKAEKFLAMVKEKKNLPGQTQESVELAADEQSRFLKAVYLKEKFPKPRNAIGMVKDLPDSEMRKLFLANTLVSEQELQGLARDRAAAVRRYLVEEGKLEKERIFEKGGDIYKKPAKNGEIASRVELGVAAQ